MKKAFLIRIIPAEQRVLAFRTDITPAIMQRLLGADKIRNGALCAIPKKGLLRYARADRPRDEYRLLPRWQLGETMPVEGEAIVFGVNADQRAASCPIGGDFFRRNITWLPALSEIGTAVLAKP